MVHNIVIAVIIIVFIVVGYLLYKRGLKEKARVESDIKETNRYLDTVLDRAALSTSVEALKLLYKELQLSRDNLLFTRNEQFRYLELKAFIIGKITGLLKLSKK